MPDGIGSALAGAAGAVGSIAGGIMGSNAQSDAADKQAAIGQQAVAGYQNIDIPSIQEQQVQLQKIASAGNLTPEQEQIFQQNQSVLNSYQQNPEASSAQMQALKSLQQIGKSGGLTAMDKANLNEIANKQSNAESQNRAAVLQNMQQRGMGGSGAELAALLSGNQQSNQEASNQGFNVAAQAQSRALQALQGAGQLGQGIEAQQFGEAGQKAAAQNAINQFNTANQQNVAGQNVQRSNYAQERNLNNNQQLNAANTNIANQNEIYNKGLYQQQFANQTTKQAGVANALNHVAAAAGAQGQAGANLGNAIGQGIGKLGSAVGTYAASSPAVGASKPAASEQTGNDFDPDKYKLS